MSNGLPQPPPGFVMDQSGLMPQGVPQAAPPVLQQQVVPQQGLGQQPLPAIMQPSPAANIPPPQVGPQFNQGDGGQRLYPGKTAMNQVDKGLLEDTDLMGELTRAQELFKPEYQTLGYRWNAKATEWAEKLGQTPDPADVKKLQEYSVYRASVGKMFSAFTKKYGGTALTPQELERIQVWAPEPGSGFFDGDAPSVLKTKLDALQDLTRRTIAKAHYIKKNGLDINAVNVEDMPAMIQRRGEELKRLYSGQIKDEAKLKMAVRERLAEEFGLLGR